MNFNIEQLEMLLKGLEMLPGNTENWNLQAMIIEEIKKSSPVKASK